jgi:agmatinase
VIPVPLAGLLTDDRAKSPFRLLGIADDSQSSFRRGAASAPARIRAAYDGRCYNATSESGVDLSGTVVDLGDLTPRASWTESAAAYRAAVEGILERDEVPFVLGGDHAVSVPVVAAFAAFGRPIHVVQIDAHPDLYPDFEGNASSHACVAARLLEMPHVATLTQLGIRTMTAVQHEVARRHADRLRVHEARNLHRDLLAHVPGSGELVYLTIDLDGFDPSCAPGVAHAVPGGLAPRDVLDLLAAARWRLVGADVVELNPARDLNEQTAILAGRLLHEAIAIAATRN